MTSRSAKTIKYIMFEYFSELYREFMHKKSSPAEKLKENEVLYVYQLEGSVAILKIVIFLFEFCCCKILIKNVFFK